MRKVYLIMSVLIILFNSCNDSISEFQAKNFIKFFGEGNGSGGADCLAIVNEGYVLVGFDSDKKGKKQVYMSKSDMYGNVIWSKRFDSEAIQEGKIIKRFDDNNFIVIGASRETTTSAENPIILKVDNYGDTVWTKRLSASYDLIINDVLITNNNIFLVGESFKNSTSSIDTYIARLDLDGNLLDEDTKSALGIQSFKNVFVNTNGNLMVLGNSNVTLSGTVNSITFTEFTPTSIKNSLNSFYIEATSDQVLNDVVFTNGQYTLLVYEQDQEGWKTRVIKVNDNASLVWSSELIADFQGQAMASYSYGDILIAGDSNSQIQFVRVNLEGDLFYGDEVYKKYPGSVGSVLITNDNGLVLVGSTPAIYDSMIQLIKTGGDFYLLKP